MRVEGKPLLVRSRSFMTMILQLMTMRTSMKFAFTVAIIWTTV